MSLRKKASYTVKANKSAPNSNSLNENTQMTLSHDLLTTFHS